VIKPLSLPFLIISFSFSILSPTAFVSFTGFAFSAFFFSLANFTLFSSILFALSFLSLEISLRIDCAVPIFQAVIPLIIIPTIYIQMLCDMAIEK
jgi:hypothetical protein